MTMRRFLTICVLLLFTAPALAARPALTATAEFSSTAAAPGAAGVIAITMTVPAGQHAQSNQPLDPTLKALKVTIDADSPVAYAPPVYPQPVVETYPLLGRVSVFTGTFTVYVPIRVPTTATGSIEVKGIVANQLCDESTCFAPRKTPFSVTIPIGTTGESKIGKPPFEKVDPKLLDAAPNVAVIGSSTLPSTAPSKYANTVIQPYSPEQIGGQAAPATMPATAPAASDLSPTDAGGPTSFAGAIGLALLVGIIFNVMPCVLPVLPLKAVGFYESAGHARSRTILFGLSFAAGMIGMFALLACVILLSKSLLGRQFQWGEQFANPWFVWAMAIVVGGLGFGMLGLFAVRLPTGVYGLNFRHDTFGGNVMWGGLTAILSTPCTAPLFPPLLAWAIAEPLVQGFAAIIAVGVGMSLPYVVLSAFPQIARKFPRTGPFAELFKQMLGFLLLGTAAFFAGIRLLHDPYQWWLVFAVAGVASIFLIARTRQLIPTPRATVFAVIGALLITSAALGSTLRLTAAPPIEWQQYTPALLAAARAGDHPVLVEFSAGWCLNCKYIEQTVYRDPSVLAALKDARVTLLTADLTDENAIGKPLLAQLGGDGIPFTAIYAKGADKPLTLESIYTSDRLKATLQTATGR